MPQNGAVTSLSHCASPWTEDGEVSGKALSRCRLQPTAGDTRLTRCRSATHPRGTGRIPQRPVGAFIVGIIDGCVWPLPEPDVHAPHLPVQHGAARMQRASIELPRLVDIEPDKSVAAHRSDREVELREACLSAVGTVGEVHKDRNQPIPGGTHVVVDRQVVGVLFIRMPGRVVHHLTVLGVRRREAAQPCHTPHHRAQQRVLIVRSTPSIVPASDGALMRHLAILRRARRARHLDSTRLRFVRDGRRDTRELRVTEAQKVHDH
eukprot:5008128-Prymnesium_polylepis.1